MPSYSYIENNFFDNISKLIRTKNGEIKAYSISDLPDAIRNFDTNVDPSNLTVNEINVRIDPENLEHQKIRVELVFDGNEIDYTKPLTFKGILEPDEYFLEGKLEQETIIANWDETITFRAVTKASKVVNLENYSYKKILAGKDFRLAKKLPEDIKNELINATPIGSARCAFMTSTPRSGSAPYDSQSVNEMGEKGINNSYGILNLVSLEDIQNTWDMSNVTDISGMFQNMDSIEELTCSNWNLTNCTSMRGVFTGLLNLKKLTLDNWTFHDNSDGNNIYDISDFIAITPELRELNITNWHNFNWGNDFSSYNYQFLSPGASKPLTVNMSNIHFKDGTGIYFNQLFSTRRGTSSAPNIGNIDKVTLNNWSGSLSAELIEYCFQGSPVREVEIKNWNIDISYGSYLYFYNWFQECGLLEKVTIKNLRFRVHPNNPSFKNNSSHYKVGDSYTHTDYNLYMYNFFSGCAKLKEIDLGEAFIFEDNGFIGEPFHYCSSMFSGCTSLERVNISNFKMYAYYDYWNSVFSGCAKLEEIIADNLVYYYNGISTGNFYLLEYMNHTNGLVNLKKVSLKNLTGPFSNLGYFAYDAFGIEEIDITGWNIPAVSYLYGMFLNCGCLKHIYGIDELNVSIGYNYDYDSAHVFTDCWCLEELNIPNWQLFTSDPDTGTGAVLKLYNMFTNCRSLKELDLSTWDVCHHKITTIAYIFAGCESLIDLNISTWNTKYFTEIAHAFAGCHLLEELDISNWNTESLQYMVSTFLGCYSLKELDLTNWDTRNLTNIAGAFSNCHSIKSFGDISNWNTESLHYISHGLSSSLYNYIVSDMGGSEQTNFHSAVFGINPHPQFNGQPPLFYDDSPNGLFSACYSIEYLDLCNWNTSNIGDMNSTFMSCTSLKVLDISNWTAFSSTICDGMFALDDALEYIILNSNEYKFKINWSNTGINSTCKILVPANAYSGIINDSYWKNHKEQIDLIENYTIQKDKVNNIITVTPKEYTVTTINLENYASNHIINYQTVEYLPNSNKIELINNNLGTNFSKAFYNCKKIKSLDLSFIDTTNVTNTSSMFEGCLELEELNLSGWNTDNVTNSSNMFLGCINLKKIILNGTRISLDLSSFSLPNDCEIYVDYNDSDYYYTNFPDLTDNIKTDTVLIVNGGGTGLNVDPNNEFISSEGYFIIKDYIDNADIRTLANLPEKNINELRGVTLAADASGAFYSIVNKNENNEEHGYLKSLEDLELTWNTSHVTNMQNMFRNTLVTKLDIYNWDVSRVTSMRAMFAGCVNLGVLAIHEWDIRSLIDVTEMFRQCTSLYKIKLDNFITSKISMMDGLLNGCNSLESINVSNWDVSHVVSLNAVFAACNKLTTLDVSNFDVSHVLYFVGTFAKCTKLQSIDVSNWNTSAALSFTDMFKECKALQSIDVSNWNTSNVTSMQSMFENAGLLTNNNVLPLTNWDTSKVTDMSRMFYRDYETNITLNLNLSNWDVSKVTTMAYMFYHNGSNSVKLDLSNWDTHSLTNMEYMFSGTSYYVSNNYTFEAKGITNLYVNNVTTTYCTFKQITYKNDETNNELKLIWHLDKVNDMQDMFSNSKIDKLTLIGNFGYDNYYSKPKTYCMFSTIRSDIIDISDFKNTTRDGASSNYGYEFRDSSINYIKTTIFPFVFGWWTFYNSSIKAFSMKNAIGCYYLYGTFYGCSQIRSINFGNLNKRFIEASSNPNQKYFYQVFYNCSNLKYLDFGKLSINYQGDSNIFYNCKSLKYIILRNSYKSYDLSIALKSIPSTCKILVYQVCLDDFKNRTDWVDSIKNKLDVIENYHIIEINEYGEFIVLPKQ